MLRIRHSGKDYLLDRVEHTGPSGQVRLIKRMRPDGHAATARELHLAMQAVNRRLDRGDLKFKEIPVGVRR